MRIDLDQAFAAIDAANGDDAKAREQGRRATHWLHRLDPSPSAAVELAARAHHLRRGTIARSSFPDGRVGYRRWRAAQKAALASSMSEALVGLPDDVVARAVALAQRDGLGTDPETQLVEDAACLVFCESDLVLLLDKLGADRTLDALRKTVPKMSAAAVALVAEATPAGPTADLLSRL